MGQSQASRFHPKYLKLCSEDEQSFYGFGMTRYPIVINDHLNFGEEYPFNIENIFYSNCH